MGASSANGFQLVVWGTGPLSTQAAEISPLPPIKHLAASSSQ